ncbi:hypothetical protein BG005_002922 [Podila minutissima]|nr:hypothetical protein BG005_002922 [Podila minutissima]
MSGSNTMPSVETEPSSSAGGDAQSNMDPNRKRRGNLPKSVTSVLKNWLVQNAIHPYPTEDEKTKLAEATHLSLNQISNWFINARRRILQPILVEAAAAAVAGTDAPMENVLIVRKGKGSRMQTGHKKFKPKPVSYPPQTTQNATIIMDNTSPPSQQPEAPHGTTNTPGTSIAPLPPECLEFILEFLSHDLPTLYRLLLVSWQFFHLTVPVLYKSPFKLAAGVTAPPSVSPHSLASAHSLSSSSYSSTTDPSMGGWTRFLRRTELLVRLLLQNIQTPTLSSRAPRLTERQILIMDTPIPMLSEEYGRVETGLEQLGSLLDGATDQGEGWEDSPSHYSSAAEELFYLDPHYHDSQVPPPNSEAIAMGSDGHSEQLPDLISFDDDDQDMSLGQYPHQPLEPSNPITVGTSSDSRKQGTGLLMDYFRYYTEHDHQSISSVLILLFPGAGRREYDRILAEIEKSILEHNPDKIVSIKIQHPSTVIPYLMQHLSLFHHLSRVELLDSNWTSQELALVCEFLEAHSAMFAAASPDAERYSDSSHNDNLINSLNIGHHHGLHGIRHLKYRTGRSHWDGVKLRNQPFNPVQLMQAIGSGTGLGLETIDSMHWPETTIEQVNALDTRFLSKLKICFLVTPHEDRSFSQPKFLERCRVLQHLEIFTSSADMLQWAVQEWNDSIRRKKCQETPSRSTLHPSLDRNLALRYPWMQRATVLSIIAQPKERPLVPLRHLRVHGPSDEIVYNVLRDALYGFRNTLEVCEVKSKLEYNGGNSEWLDHADELLSRRSSSSIDQRNKNRRAVIPGGEMRVSGPDRRPTNYRDMDEDELAEKCYLNMPSVESGLLTVRWTVPYLAMLDLYGSIALQFDLSSLAYMPRLHTVCFSIQTAPSLRRRRYRRNDDLSGGATSRYAGFSDLTCLSLVTGPRLKRVLIQGPWPEISDRSLLEMVETRVERESQGPRQDARVEEVGDEDMGGEDVGDEEGEDDEQGGGMDVEEEEEEATWGNQLLELTVLDNDQVTVSGMVLLARQMDQLEVMGLTLYFPVFSQHQYLHSQHRQQQQDTGYRYPSNIIQRSYHYYCNPSTSTGPSLPTGSSSPEDAETMARNELLRAQLELPWVDLGPDANHLAKRTHRGGFLDRGWIL